VRYSRNNSISRKASCDCVDLAQLWALLHATRPDIVPALGLDEDGPIRRKFLARLQGEISKRGTIDVLRHGINHGAHRVDLFYGTPSPGNTKAMERYDANRFSVTRQLRYSRDETQRALDLAFFINGLPVATFELKNSLTKQTAADAEEQYKRDRDPREKLFEFGRCVVHFAVDENEVRFCTHLKGKSSWFLPFNRGWNDGAGNPPNPNGLKTDFPVEAHSDARRTYGHSRELRSDRRRGGSENQEEEAHPDLAAISPARRRAQAARRRAGERRRAPLSRPAFGRQWQIQLHRVALAPAHPPRERRGARVRLDHRRYRPKDS
jgi:hypothetical protein